MQIIGTENKETKQLGLRTFLLPYESLSVYYIISLCVSFVNVWFILKCSIAFVLAL